MDLQQYTHRNNIEARGVLVAAGKDVYVVIGSIAKALDVSYVKSGISSAHRLRASAKGTPITCRKLHGSLSSLPIYVSEHLSPHNKHLFAAAKRLVKVGKIKFDLSNDGRVMVRKTMESAAIYIKHLSDLHSYEQ